MRKRVFVFTGAAVLFSAVCVLAQQKNAPSSQMKSATAAVEGLVRDIACPIQNAEATATNFNLQCALDCARQGSPLIILSKQGTIYIPISNEMPDKSQTQRLMPFLGKWVRVTGHVYTRGGAHAIAIDTIEEVKGVRLNSNAQ